MCKETVIKCWSVGVVLEGKPGAEVTIFADLSLRFAADNLGLFSTVNLCQFESNQ